MRQKHCWNYQLYLSKGKIIPVIIFPYEAKYTQPFGISKIKVYLASEGKALLDLYCH